MGIYVETLISGNMDELWQKTQSPDLHQRWDLRFSNIAYLPRPSLAEPQRFRYATHIGFGLNISGAGESVGEFETENRRTSALKFWSDDPKSLIAGGSGFWSYVQQEGGIQFLTWYDYRTRFGRLGQLFDAILFRPLMGWATAWSFDRLRLWIERGIDPASSLRNSVVHAIARLTLAAIWLYHGLVPKLLLTQRDEVTMLLDAGVSASAAPTLVRLVGACEVAFGLLLLTTWRKRWPLILNIPSMCAATAGVALRSPQYLGAAFNPITLDLSVVALSVIGLIAGAASPFAGRCLRKRRERHA
ncbi:MAG TPA: DoxX-like family protein [Ktedonobacterales bacterium]|jgi:hypothetical protein|nr:DoxX-like family protein [Ktedonobacterales bacterium]